MPALKRVKYAKEPILHVHRYIVGVSFHVKPKKGKAYFHTNYHYALNLKEARAVAKEVISRRKDALVEVYAANHNFREAWKAR